jgi:hypothetical protein
MSEVKVNKISPRTNCGTVQLGDSGDTITIPAGATITNNGTQTGFGRTGTVDWDTTAKTASFTAVSGNGYFVNTTSGAITLTLPSSPSAGDIVAFKDYAFTFATNNLTVDGNGSPIGGVDGTVNPTYDTNGTSKTFIYVDGTKGWLVTNESTDTSQEAVPTYIVATGGTVTCCGDYKIHTFTGPGTFTVCSVGNPAGSNSVSYMVVAGGGGGGRGTSVPAAGGGGGGGAGGFREGKASSDCYTASPLNAPTGLPVSATGYPITVGAGGAGDNCYPVGDTGSNSVFSTITSAGGGGGAFAASNITSGVSGGSGGGSGAGTPSGTGAPAPGGTGNTPPVSPPQGQDGGGITYNGWRTGGSGGGAGGAGRTNVNSQPEAIGGPGVGTEINPSPSYGTSGPSAPLRYFAGGGGAGSGLCNEARSDSVGGGGQGMGDSNILWTSGQTNTGGGGGGGTDSPSPSLGSGSGGSGIVIIRYRYQ